MNTYINTFSIQEEPRVKKFFQDDNAVFAPLQYGKWQAKGKGYIACYYDTGKFAIQGKDVRLIVAFFEKYMGISTLQNPQEIINSFNLNKKDIPFSEYIGTDESGKGDLFGPLVVAAVYTNEELTKKFVELGIKDSKKLDDKNICNLAFKIKQLTQYSVLTIMPEKYNQLYGKFKNLNKMLAWAHAEVIKDLMSKIDCKQALVDKFGKDNLMTDALSDVDISLEQRTKAEMYPGVAAASVLARAGFVRANKSLSDEYNIYLAKGATELALLSGREFVERYGQEKLPYVAKMHFKSIKEL